MGSTSRDIAGERQLVASAAPREVAGGRHQMLPDSRGARLRIDDDILDNREGLQRMTQMRDDDQVAGADDFARDFGDEDRMIAIASQTSERRGEPGPRNSQAHVIVEMKLVVEFLQSRKIELVRAADSD